MFDGLVATVLKYYELYLNALMPRYNMTHDMQGNRSVIAPSNYGTCWLHL